MIWLPTTSAAARAAQILIYRGQNADLHRILRSFSGSSTTLPGMLARCCSVFLALSSLGFAAEAPGFKVTNRFQVPGDGGFDYVVFDSSAQRLYVSHGTKVDVLDANSGKVLGSIEDTPGVHGIAIVPDLHRGFTTNGGDSTVSVFDTTTLKTIQKITVDKDPDFTFYDPKTKRVLVCHGDAAAITAIDPEKQTVIGKVALGGGAEAAVVDGKGNGFVNLEEEAMVVKFDPQGLTVKQKWPITGCKTPTGLAMDTANSRLFIGCRSKVLAVMDSNNGKVIQTLPIGDRVDAVAFDPATKLIFASNGDGTVSVIREKSSNSYESVGDIQTQKSAKTMAYDPATKRLFLSAAEMESVPGSAGDRPRMHPKPGSFVVLVVSSSADNASSGPYHVQKTAKVGGDGGFDYVYADAAGRRLYVPRPGTPGRIAVFNLDTLEPAGQIADASARGVAVDPKSQHGFATSKPVVMWDTKTLATIKTIDVEGGPDGILFDPFNSRVYVFSHRAPNATVINSADGSVVGTIDLGGAPEQAVTDGKGHVYVDIEDVLPHQ